MNAPPVAGALLDGRYRVGPVLALGGMSTVHRGVDTRLDRPVAIKIMDGRLAADPAFRARFEREARSAARIDHPAVVDVFDQGADVGPGGPVLFLVMELVDGGTLRDVLRARGALGVPAAVAVLEQVLAGLAQAHRLGLVHRDVKPENVLVSAAREVKVADFGLVVAAAEAGLSHAGMIMGTVAYLSPEQVTTGQADPRSDVYAAGVLLYELLTGTPPYTGETAISVAYRHVNSDVPAPSLVAGDVPPELDDLVARATRRDPSARPPDAAAMLAELRHVARQLEVPVVRPPAPPPRPADDHDDYDDHDDDTVPGMGAHGTRVQPRPHDTQYGAAAPYPRPRRHGRRLLTAGVTVVALLLALLGVSLWWLATGQFTAVPPVLGLEQVEAERLVRDADLVPVATRGRDDTVPAGRVSATDVPAGTRLSRGRAVAITVSTGRPTVPALSAGTALDAARQAVREAGLEPVLRSDDDEFSEIAPPGTVIRSDPAAGTVLTTGAPVTLVLSRGPEPEPQQVRVPFVVGRSFAEAEQELEELGLQAKEQPVLGFGRRNANVVNQRQGAGSLVAPGTVIVLETL